MRSPLDRMQYRIPVFYRDVFDAGQRPKDSTQLSRGDFVETTQDPFQFQQHRSRDERTLDSRLMWKLDNPYYQGIAFEPSNRALSR